MIRFLRFRLITNFFNGNVRKYLLYAIGEIILITFGILIALKINAWNQEQVDRELEQVFLNRILEDLSTDIKVFTSETELGESGLEAIKQALSLMDDIDSAEGAIEFNKLYDATFMGVLSPQYGTYHELRSTGQMNIIQNDSLRSAILDHYAFYERMEEEFQFYAWYRKSVSRDMDTYTSVVKYAGDVEKLFPPERLVAKDWAFFKDPDSEEYRHTEIALAMGGWSINYDLFMYSLLFERIQALEKQIRTELEKLQ